VTLGEKTIFDECISMGDSKTRVIEIMGTPTTIYEAMNTWSYGADTIDFDNSNRVSSWSNSFENLRVK
jgi:hypothetical protein